MNTVLVTGGNGFLGSNLVGELVRRGFEVRVLHRAQSDLTNIDALKVDHFIGDIRDAAVLRKAMRGCDTVFHTAAVLGFWKPIEKLQSDVNINGTRAVLEACIASGIKRLVHTSSIAALGRPETDGDLADEETAYNWSEKSGGYKRTKHLAEIAVLEAVSSGLDAVIVNPSVIIGPGDTHFNGGQLIRSVARGFVPFYIRGGMNVVYVADVVRGHIAAAEAGRTGERYILGGDNVTHKNAFGTVAQITGRRPPRLELPIPILKGAAALLDGASRLLRRPPIVSPGLVAGAGICNWYSSAKAIRDLGYTITPFPEAVRLAYEWYRATGLL